MKREIFRQIVKLLGSNIFLYTFFFAILLSATFSFPYYFSQSFEIQIDSSGHGYIIGGEITHGAKQLFSLSTAVSSSSFSSTTFKENGSASFSSSGLDYNLIKNEVISTVGMIDAKTFFAAKLLSGVNYLNSFEHRRCVMVSQSPEFASGSPFLRVQVSGSVFQTKDVLPSDGLYCTTSSKSDFIAILERAVSNESPKDIIQTILGKSSFILFEYPVYWLIIIVCLLLVAGLLTSIAKKVWRSLIQHK